MVSSMTVTEKGKSSRLTDNSDALGADVDFDKTGVDGLVELPESGDETDRSLL